LFLVERFERLRSEDLEHVGGKFGVGDDNGVGPGSDDPEGRWDPLDQHRGVAGEGAEPDPIDLCLNKVDDGGIFRAGERRGLAPDLSR